MGRPRSAIIKAANMFHSDGGVGLSSCLAECWRTPQVVGPSAIDGAKPTR